MHNPAYGTLDARIQYVRNINRMKTEFFLDLFNVFDDQATIRTEDLVAGTGTTKFGDPILWVQPRRAFLGARVGF